MFVKSGRPWAHRGRISRILIPQLQRRSAELSLVVGAKNHSSIQKQIPGMDLTDICIFLRVMHSLSTDTIHTTPSKQSYWRIFTHNKTGTPLSDMIALPAASWLGDCHRRVRLFGKQTWSWARCKVHPERFDRRSLLLLWSVVQW